MSKRSIVDFYLTNIAPQPEATAPLAGADHADALQAIVTAEHSFSPFLQLYVQVTESQSIQLLAKWWERLVPGPSGGGTGGGWSDPGPPTLPGYCEYLPCQNWPLWS